MGNSAYGEMEFAQKLERVIAQSGMSQSAIARETGISQSAISAMTRGDRRPYMDQAIKLEALLRLATPVYQESPPKGVEFFHGSENNPKRGAR